MTLSLIVLFIGWIGIVALQIYENNIQDYFKNLNPNSSLLAFVGNWAPTVFVTFINYLIPWMLGKITEYEGWDFSATRLKHEIWRTYAAGILNNIIFALVYAELIVQKNLFRSNEALTEFKTNLDCRED